MGEYTSSEPMIKSHFVERNSEGMTHQSKASARQFVSFAFKLRLCRNQSKPPPFSCSVITTVHRSPKYSARDMPSQPQPEPSSRIVSRPSLGKTSFKNSNIRYAASHTFPPVVVKWAISVRTVRFRNFQRFPCC